MNYKLVEKTLIKLKGRALAEYWLKITKDRQAKDKYLIWYNGLSQELKKKIGDSYKDNTNLLHRHLKLPKNNYIIVISQKVIKEITKLLDYCEETSSEERKGHIYETIKYLRNAIKNRETA